MVKTLNLTRAKIAICEGKCSEKSNYLVSLIRPASRVWPKLGSAELIAPSTVFFNAQETSVEGMTKSVARLLNDLAFVTRVELVYLTLFSIYAVKSALTVRKACGCRTKRNAHVFKPSDTSWRLLWYVGWCFCRRSCFHVCNPRMSLSDTLLFARLQEKVYFCTSYFSCEESCERRIFQIAPFFIVNL